jgi:DNA polymerase III subunit epsilon
MTTRDRVVVFDVETTGLAPSAGHRIIEIGAVRLDRADVKDEFDRLIDPGRPVPLGAQRVHGIDHL